MAKTSTAKRRNERNEKSKEPKARPAESNVVALPRRQGTSSPKSKPRALVTESGVSAELEGETIVLREKTGTILLRYDASTGALELHAEGDLQLSSGRAVRVKAGTDVHFEAAGSVLTTSTGVSVHAKTADVNIDEGKLVARALTSLVGRLEVRAQRLFEKAGDAYREVDNLLETRAGRMRTLVKGAFRVLSERNELIAQGDSIVDGKRVLLG